MSLTQAYLSYTQAWTRDSMEFEQEPVSDLLFTDGFQATFSHDRLGLRVLAAHECVAIKGFTPTESNILSLFALISASDPAWRTMDVQVGGHHPPPSYRVPEEMRNFVLNLQARLEFLSLATLLEAFAYLEGEFLRVHPFPDLNGRMSRLLMVGLARQVNLPPIFPIYPGMSKLAYFADLRVYDHTKNPRVLLGHWERRLAHALDLSGHDTLAAWNNSQEIPLS